MRNQGFTLMEMTFVMAIMTIVVGTLMGLALSFGDTARLQNLQANANDEVRRAVLIATPSIRQAQRVSINWDQLPGEVLTYRIPADVDGNGTPVNQRGMLELGPTVTITRDYQDLNNDGLREEQLILEQGGAVRVLANTLAPESEGVGEDGIFTDFDDTNGNGQQDAGVWFTSWEGGLRMTIQVTGTDRRGRVYRTEYEEIVFPRN